MNEVRDFIIDKMPAGVIVFDQKLDVIFSNKQAKLFFKRHEFPDDIRTICRRIFAEVASRLKELFPGDIHLIKKLEGSPNQWSFKIRICEGPKPFVAVFIIEESLSDKIDLNDIRGRFKLTRRETDVLRCALSGLKNTDIADELEISEYTVKDYLSNIYLKTGVESRFALRKRFFTYDLHLLTPSILED